MSTATAVKAKKTKKNDKAKAKATKPKAEKKPKIMSKPQARILDALKKIGRPLTRAALAKAAKVDFASLTEYAGSADPDVRAKNDKKHFMSLKSLKFVDFGPDDEGTTYVITATGKKALETYNNQNA